MPTKTAGKPGARPRGPNTSVPLTITTRALAIDPSAPRNREERRRLRAAAAARTKPRSRR